jgi:hypothetical protein
MILDEFFPFIVRKKLIRELIVFKFHSKEVPLRTYIDEIVHAAEFLNYLGTESELVDRILMNLHPDVLAQSAFLQRPSSFHELRKLTGHMEEKLAVQVERQSADVDRIVPSDAEPVPPVVARYREGQWSRQLSFRQLSSRQHFKCWKCGKMGHLQRACRAKISSSGNGQRPGTEFPVAGPK